MSSVRFGWINLKAQQVGLKAKTSIIYMLPEKGTAAVGAVSSRFGRRKSESRMDCDGFGQTRPFVSAVLGICSLGVTRRYGKRIGSIRRGCGS